MALAANGEGVAIVPSNVSIPRKGVKAMSVTYRGTPIGRWVLVASIIRRALRQRASRPCAPRLSEPRTDQAHATTAAAEVVRLIRPAGFRMPA